MLFLLHISPFRKTKKSHKVLDRTKLPNKCITEVSGAVVFQEQNDLVYPLLDFPEEDINKYSRKIIGSHSEQLRHARVIMQVSLILPCFLRQTSFFGTPDETVLLVEIEVT